MTMLAASNVCWSPNLEKTTNMDRLVELINKKYNLDLSAKGTENYKKLYEWTCENYSEFWESMWEFSDVKHSVTYDQVVDKSKNISEIPEWFHGARLNYAEQALRWDDDGVAIISTGELQTPTTTTYKQLKVLVQRLASSLRSMGVTEGDRVAGYLPNCVQTTAFMLAVSSIGAIWCSTSPDFGVNGVLERFNQIQPKVLVSVNAVAYNGKIHDHSAKVNKVSHSLQSLEKVVIFDFVKSHEYKLSDVHEKAVTWDDFICSEADALPLEFAQLPFNHPLFIMFSSGTTGVPKCMVHSAGGTLIQHMKEMLINSDLQRDDTLFFYTTTGWMMWNWLMGGLLCGAAIVTYDGSPFKPADTTLFDLAQEHKFTVLGTSPKWLQTCRERGLKPAVTHDLSHLKAILSTGAPLTPDTFDYVYSDIKKDLLLGSISGGTDIISCFCGNNTNVPVVRGEIQTRNLGMAIEAWIDQDKPVLDESGELVCTKPFPSQPVYFWNDADGAKYKKAYFSTFKNVWGHGDFCQVSSVTGGVTMQGRSDGTLNPAGVRFGSAEIYNVMHDVKEVKDSLCVGQKIPGSCDERVVLFVLMEDGISFTPEIEKKIKVAVRAGLSARHVPSFVLETKAIPYTINGKKIEVAVKKALVGERVDVRNSFQNPESLDFYYDIPCLAFD